MTNVRWTTLRDEQVQPFLLPTDVTLYHEKKMLTLIYSGLNRDDDEGDFRAWAAVTFAAEIGGDWPHFVAYTAQRG